MTLNRELKTEVRKVFTEHPTVIQMAREVCKLFTEEEWAEINGVTRLIQEDMWVKIVRLAPKKVCLYSLEESLFRASEAFERIRKLPIEDIAPEILRFFIRDLLKNKRPLTIRDFAC